MEEARLGVAPGRALQGREDELRRVVGAVLRGVSVEVVGPRGSGRTALADEVGRTLRGLGRSVLHVTGDADLGDLDALRLSLPPGPQATAHGAGDPAHRVYRSLAAVLDDRDPVVVLDDVDLLDPRSRAVVAQLRGRRGATIVATSCPGRSRGSGHGWLSDRCQPVLQVRLAGLTVEDIHAILSARVGGDLCPRVAARVWEQTGGLPGLAAAVLESEVARDAVGSRDDLWVDLAPAHRDDGTTFAVLLAGLPTHTHEAAETLALTGPLPLRAAQQLVAAPALEDLEARGLLRVTPTDDGGNVSVQPPGLSDHLVAACTPARRARLAAHIEGAGVTPGPSDLSPLALGRRHGEALRAAVRRWDADPTAAHAAVAMRLALAAPERQEAMIALVGRTGSLPDDGGFDAVAVAYYQARWALSEGAPVARVCRDLEQAPCRDERERGALSSLAILLRDQAGCAQPGADAVLRERMRGDDDPSRTARLVLACWSMLRGRQDEALGLLGAGYDGWPEPLRSSAVLVHGLALVGSGDFTGAQAFAESARARAYGEVDGAAYAASSLVAALGHGAVLDLAAVRRSVVGLLASGLSGTPLPLPVDRAAETVLATAELFTGHDVMGRALVRLARREQGTVALPFATGQWCAALDHYAAGERSACARALDGAEDEHHAAGHTFAGDLARMVRLMIQFEAAPAEAFRPRAARIGGPVFVAYLHAKRAMHDDDPHQLMSAGDRLRRLAALQGAARCYADAAGLFDRGGQGERAAHARTTAHALAGRGAPVRPAARSRASARVRLSVRETEIVSMIAQGHSNTAIADRLFLSPRTVESHVRNIKRKTGAADRAAIARLAHEGPVGAA